MLVFTPKFEKIWQKFEFRGKNSELGKNFPELEHKLAELEHNLIELDQDSNSSKGQNSQEKKTCMYVHTLLSENFLQHLQMTATKSPESAQKDLCWEEGVVCIKK